MPGNGYGLFMCGRFTLRTSLAEVAVAFDLPKPGSEPKRQWQLRFNIAPSQPVAAVRRSADAASRELAWFDWGLVPSWADDPAIGNRMINARGETAATKPAFREAFAKRRCLILADGFYEWKQGAKPKQPYYITLADERPFAFAGLWEHWQRGELLIASCTIITTEANALLRDLHDRMPVILDPSDYDTWLDPRVQDAVRLEGLVRPLASEQMALRPVSSAVNSPGTDGPALVKRVDPGKVQGTLFD